MAEEEIVVTENLDANETAADTEKEALAEAAEAVAEANLKRPRKHSSDENKVTLIGSVAKKVIAPKQGILTLCVKVNGIAANYPTIKFYGDTIKKLESLNVDDRVCVIATIQSYDIEKDEKSAKRNPYQLVGKDVYLNEPTAAGPDDEGFVPLDKVIKPDFNEISIKGTVLELRKSKQRGTVLVKIRTHVDGRMSIIEFPYAPRSEKLFYSSIHIDQRVRATGIVQTANIPIDVDAEEKAETTVGKDLRADRNYRPHLKTKKKEYYILYDIYAPHD